MIQGALSLPEPLDASVVTLGTFDGVHQGHQTLLKRAVEHARASGVSSVAYTFDPHPAKILAPHAAPKTLMALGERVRHFGVLGVDTVVVETFDRALSELSADDWVQRYLVEQLTPVRVVVGFNFSYGRGREGNVEHLRACGARLGFEVEVVDAIAIEGLTVSSTKVRKFLLEGDLPNAKLLLGRPFAVTGRCVPGDQRGRTIGFPTANVEPEHELLPKPGVYATRTAVIDADGENVSSVHDSVTNIGKRPTFAGQDVRVESHLLDFQGDLYERRLRVELVERLRDEQRFEGIDALKRQLHTDVESARQVLSK